MVKSRITFLSWGKRGAINALTRAIGHQALRMPDVRATISVSRQNEDFESYREFGDALFPVDTFSSNIGALKGLWRVPQLRKALRERMVSDGTDAVVTLMPHVWTPFMVGAVHNAGARYATIVHDGVPHPGDPTALVHRLLLSEARQADAVVTLSEAVREQLVFAGLAKRTNIRAVFLPDLHFGDAPHRSKRRTGRPLRLLFVGRIMAYKGLGLFVEAIELLRRRGVPVEIGVYGEGSLSPYEERLLALGATVDNRWLAENEIAGIFANYDAVALSHLQASQSGVAATAFGAALPVVATPVGGLCEQVKDGITGVLAKAVSPSAFADGVQRLVEDSELYDRIVANLTASAATRSTENFVRAVIDAALGREVPKQSRPD
jgi:glycosyltransferase involved in cell wall biosynthesis